MKEQIKEKVIKMLGGYTKTEVKAFKKSIRKLVEEMKVSKRLKEAEKELLYNFRTDAIYSKAKASIELERR